MSYANYRDIERAIRSLEGFTGNSARGAWDSEGIYTVFSYTTPIAKANARTGGMVVNLRQYSKTTSRLQNIIHRAWENYSVSETL